MFIHESIQGSMVGFQLAFQVREERKLFLAFGHVYPGIEGLQKVFLACVEKNLS